MKQLLQPPGRVSIPRQRGSRNNNGASISAAGPGQYAYSEREQPSLKMSYMNLEDQWDHGSLVFNVIDVINSIYIS